MKLQKHEREALSAVRRMGLGVVAQLYPAGKHSKLIAQFADKQVRVMTLPSKNVSLAECLNSDKENGNDECETGTLHA